MPLEFKGSSSVASGTFNIYIFQPKWLRKRIPSLSADESATIQSDLTQPAFRVRHPTIPDEWIITPDSIIVSTEAQDVACGEILAEALEALPETPMRDVGNNFTYHAPADAAPDGAFWLGNAGIGEEVAEVGGIVAFLIGDARFNLAVIREEDFLRIEANVHRVSQESSKCIAAAKSFRADRDRVVEIANQLLGLEACK